MENIGRLCVTRRAGETLIIKNPDTLLTFSNITRVSAIVTVIANNREIDVTLTNACPLKLPCVTVELLEARSRGQARLCISADRSINIVRGELVKK